jgi:hypothetical protein
LRRSLGEQFRLPCLTSISLEGYQLYAFIRGIGDYLLRPEFLTDRFLSEKWERSRDRSATILPSSKYP